MSKFYSNGKLLITGEYLVLDGAKSLALPTQKGQSLVVKPIKEPRLIWESFNDKNERWLHIEFDLPKLRIVSETFDSTIEDGSDSLALRLQQILLEAKRMNSQFLASNRGFHGITNLDFPRNWGLGSSSTLVNNIANWANVNAFELQFKTFGGSGYDIACAQHSTPITYQLKTKKPVVTAVNFNPSFKEQLYFVHLNKKQNSRDAIAVYKNFKGDVLKFSAQISDLTDAALKSNSLSDFEKILKEHEVVIASIIGKRPIQEELFSDYFGQLKSLGGWGGDFILATGNKNTLNYFKSKGYTMVIPYTEMII